MKITFLGNFGVEYSSETHYLKTLLKLGHEVITLQEGKPIDLSQMGLILNSDIFFWVHTHGWITQGLEQVLTEVKDFNIPIVGYHLDLWMGIQRQKDLDNDSYWKWMDYFFCTDQLMVDYLNEQGKIKAHFLPAGVFEDECYIGTPRPEYKYDVIFVGSRGYHKEWPYREKLINFLEKTYGSRFAQFGGGGKGTIRGSDLNDLYASAKVVVGDTLCKGFDYPYYLSDRIFETTGRGGFIIHPFIKGISELFNTCGLYAENFKEPEIAIYEFNHFEYLKYLIDYFIANDDEREAIRIRGHERTKKDHTYTKRLTEMLNTVVKS